MVSGESRRRKSAENQIARSKTKTTDIVGAKDGGRNEPERKEAGSVKGIRSSSGSGGIVFGRGASGRA